MNNKLSFAVAATEVDHPSDPSMKIVDIYWNDIYKRVIREGSLRVYVKDFGGSAEKVLYINNEFDLSEDTAVSQRDEDAITTALSVQHPETYQKISINYDGTYARITAHVNSTGKFIVRNFLAFREGAGWIIKEVR